MRVTPLGVTQRGALDIGSDLPAGGDALSALSREAREARLANAGI